MKNVLISVALLLVVLLAGCSKDQITAPADNNTSVNGNVLLKFNKTDAPSAVTSLTAYLARQGYDTLKANLNLLTDSTADISFNNIPIGVWQLRIDANNSAGIVLYSGNAQVEVKASTISQVSITLNPTSSTTGGIYILVNWGKILPQWIDYPSNPIFTKKGIPYDSRGVMDPRIIYDEGIYKMWYGAIASDQKLYILYASSLDGLNWTYRDTIPSIWPGQAGSWNDVEVDPGAVIKEQNSYKMYYNGLSSSGKWSIGLATSTDGFMWTQTGQPILTGLASWEYNLSVSDVIKIGNVYYMYYQGTTSDYYYTASIGLATSTDGINFTKYSGNPILTKTQDWEGRGVYCGTVINDNGLYKMVYQNSFADKCGFGMATSADGIHWSKDAANPFFTNLNTANNWSSSETSYPFFRKFNNEYRVYYCGLINNQRCIGVVRLSQ